MIAVWIVVPVVGTLTLAIATIWLRGRSLPQDHSVTRTQSVAGAPEQVWTVITDFANEGAWNRAIRRSVKDETAAGRDVWITTDRRGGDLPLETVEMDAPRRLVRKIANPDLPYGGQWTITLEPDGDATRVSVTEDGEVYNAFMRFFAHYFMDQSATVEQYLEGLAAHMHNRSTL